MTTKKQLDLEFKQLAVELDQREVALTRELNALTAPIKQELAEIALERRAAWNKFKSDCAAIDAADPHAPKTPQEAREQARSLSRRAHRKTTMLRLRAQLNVLESQLREKEQEQPEWQEANEHLPSHQYNKLQTAKFYRPIARLSKQIRAIATQIAMLEEEETLELADGEPEQDFAE
jgi:hypothetical protein